MALISAAAVSLAPGLSPWPLPRMGISQAPRRALAGGGILPCRAAMMSMTPSSGFPEAMSRCVSIAFGAGASLFQVHGSIDPRCAGIRGAGTGGDLPIQGLLSSPPGPEWPGWRGQKRFWARAEARTWLRSSAPGFGSLATARISANGPIDRKPNDGCAIRSRAGRDCAGAAVLRQLYIDRIFS